MNQETLARITTLVGSKRIAEGVLRYLGSVREMPTVENIRKALNVTPTTARKIRAIAELSGDFLMDTMPVHMNNPHLVAGYLSDLKNAPTEHVVALSVASDNTLIRRHECSTGATNRATVDPCIVFSGPVQDKARSVIVAHNHPSGSVEFSHSDYDFTEQLVKAGRLLNIRVLDSIVISHRGIKSMRAERPEMFADPKPSQEPKA
jgi:DNA repair protein RadC